MKINVVAVAKPDRDCYQELTERFIKMSGRYAAIEMRELFNAKVHRAQESGAEASRKIYRELFAPWAGRGFTIALDPAAKEVDTPTFADLLRDRQEVTFFIGGAYGHGSDFLKQCDKSLSLSKLTMSHKVAKVVLFEQIYRALTILHNHPYHK